MTVAGSLTDRGGIIIRTGGSLAGNVTDQGSIVVGTGGSLAGSMSLYGSASAEFQGQVGNSTTIVFSGTSGRLLIDDLASDRRRTTPGFQRFRRRHHLTWQSSRHRHCRARPSFRDHERRDGFNAATDTTPLVLTSNDATVGMLALDGDYHGIPFSVTSGGIFDAIARALPAVSEALGPTPACRRPTGLPPTPR